jgi:hypothetical protein
LGFGVQEEIGPSHKTGKRVHTGASICLHHEFGILILAVIRYFTLAGSEQKERQDNI